MSAQWFLYVLIVSLVTLLNVAFTILRGARSALAVADSGGSAFLIPYYELLGTLPAAILMSWGLARLLRRIELSQLFSFVLLGFLLFFGLYSCWIYPTWRAISDHSSAPTGWLLHLPILLFFSIAELWKVALLSILLWGYLNRNITFDRAKVLYGPVMLGTSLGAMLAHPIVKMCGTLSWLDGIAIDHWHASLSMQLAVVCLIGVVILLLFQLLLRNVGEQSITPEIMSQLGLWESLWTSIRSKHLRNLAFIVIADYIVYSLVEVVFLDKLKERYPNPVDYCEVMTQLSQWGGLLTAITTLYVAPRLLGFYSWLVAALVTPLVLLPVVLSFLAAVIALEYGWVAREIGVKCVLWSGYLFYCLGRATKYALLDSAKELAFIPLSHREQLQGKIAIEAMASRGGRGIASTISIVLFGVAGSIASSAPLALSVALLGIYFWLSATFNVGREMAVLSPHSSVPVDYNA